MKVSYSSKGLVYGNFWGGGAGAYEARRLNAPSEEELLKEANAGLDGSLDGGMGFESLKGALLAITKITTTIIENKGFINKETEIRFIGNLTEEEQDFLTDIYYEQA